MEEKKPRRWWARLDKRKIFRCVVGVGWLSVYFLSGEKYYNAVNTEEKIDAIFFTVQGIWLIGLCLMDYWDHLLHRQPKTQQPTQSKDASA